MTASTVRDAEAEAAAALDDVERAEQELAAGKRPVSARKLHELRDRFRHAELKAQGESARAERERQAARMTGLEQIGAEVDELANGPVLDELTGALQAVADACSRFQALAAEHDAAVGELVAAAGDLGAEPLAPGGARPTSAHVAVDKDGIVHRRTTVRPVSGQVLAALGRAMVGEPGAAAGMLQAVGERPEPQRPTYLLRGRGGALHSFDTLSPAMRAQVASGELEQLSDTDIDRWLAGEIA